jgi:beta-xylosidase
MSNLVKIEANVDTSNHLHLAALSSFLHVLGGLYPTNVESTQDAHEEQVETTEEVKPVTKKRAKKADLKKEDSDNSAVDAYEKAKEVEVIEPEEVEAEEPEEITEEKQKGTISLSQVREALSLKVQKHKEVLREELGRLGTNNVTNMNPRDYSGFYKFLLSLD